MRRWVIILAGLLLAAAVAGWWWSASRPQPPVIRKVAFVPHALVVALSRRSPVERILVSTPAGRTLGELRLAGVKRRRLRLALNWSPGESYVVQVSGPGGSDRRRVRAPRQAAGELSLELLIPFGGARRAGEMRGFASRLSSQAVVMAQSLTTGALIIRNQRPGILRVEIRLPDGARLDRRTLSPGLELRQRRGEQVLLYEKRLVRPQQTLPLIFRLRLPTPGYARLTARVEFRRGGQARRYLREARLQVLDRAHYARLVEVTGAWLPTGREGYFDRRKQPDTIYYRPEIFRRLGRWLGVGAQRASYWLPYTYQSLAVENLSGGALALMIKSRILPLEGEEIPLAFRPPDVFTGTLQDLSVAVSLGLEPGETARAVIPIFLTGPPRPGRYRRVITLHPMGSQVVLKRLEYPLYVASFNLTAWAFCLASLGISVLGFGVLGFGFRRLLAGLKIRWVVIVALFGSLTFVGVNLPMRMLGSLIYGLLGPFSALVLGFFNDLLYFSLLVALVRLIPRPGVVSLITLVRYLLSVMLTGGFNLTDFLFVGTSLVVKESAFWLAGVTRRGEAFSWSWRATAGLALCLGLGEAFLNLTSLYLHMVFFRLYFADWYLYLHVIFNGMIYTALGTFVGRSFSQRLVWAEE